MMWSQIAGTAEVVVVMTHNRVTREKRRQISLVALCDIEPPARRIALQQPRSIFRLINERSRFVRLCLRECSSR